MREELLNKLPTWYKNINKNKYYLILSNDMDSFYSCQLLHKKFGVQIGGFFDINNGFYVDRAIAKGKEPIGVDLSLTHGKCFDNHFTMLKNPQAINPNVIINDYYKKYNGSTFAFLLALYNINLHKFNDLQTGVTIALDGWNAGYYKYNGKFRDVTINWTILFEIDDVILPFLAKHDKQYFADLNDKYHVNTQISVQNGKLYRRGYVIKGDYSMILQYPVERLYLDDVSMQYIAHDNILTSAATFKHRYSICRKGELT